MDTHTIRCKKKKTGLLLMFGSIFYGWLFSEIPVFFSHSSAAQASRGPARANWTTYGNVTTFPQILGKPGESWSRATTEHSQWAVSIGHSHDGIPTEPPGSGNQHRLGIPKLRTKAWAVPSRAMGQITQSSRETNQCSRTYFQGPKEQNFKPKIILFCLFSNFFCLFVVF